MELKDKFILVQSHLVSHAWFFNKPILHELAEDTISKIFLLYPRTVQAQD